MKIMNISRLDLLTLLISLFSFSACQKPNSVGLMVNPQDAVSGSFTNTIVITTKTVLDNDRILTSSLRKYPAGVLTDPVFGTTTSNILMSLNLPSNNLTFGTTPVFDKAELVLNYANEYYGDPNAEFTFEVYQLADRLVPTSTLNNTNSTTPTSPKSLTLIGTSKVNINSSVLAVGGVSGTSIRIQLNGNSDTLGKSILSADSSNFVSNDSFDDFIKGLYLKATPTAGTGGIIFFDLSTGGSRLELSYHNAADATVKSVTFPIQASAANPSVAAFSHHFAGGSVTEVETQLSTPSTAYNYTFVQPMAGVRTQVNFPDLSPLTTLGNITINKAELVVSTYPLGATDIFTPAPRLYLYRTDIAGQRKFVPDCNITDPRSLSDVNFGGIYSATDGKYRFIITSYIQDLVNGKLKQYDTYLSVAESAASRSEALYSSATTAKRVVIGSGTNSDPLYQMKLNVIYSKAN